MKKKCEIPFDANFMANNDELQILLHVTWEVHTHIDIFTHVYIRHLLSYSKLLLIMF